MTFFRQSAQRFGELTFPPLAVLAIGTWVISPRFSITGPSLIDDWKALVSTPAAVHAFRFSYHIDEARFRPGVGPLELGAVAPPGSPGKDARAEPIRGRSTRTSRLGHDDVGVEPRAS